MAPSTVRMVLVEGESADGVTVDHDGFDVARPNEPVVSAPDQVISAILGTRESAFHGGYNVASTGVTVTDQVQAAILRDALAAHKIENVMLVSAFLAAAALAQAVGNATHYGRTGLLFVEPDTATLAVVDTADGSVAELQRRILPGDDDAAVGELAQLVASADQLETPPDGMFVVGAGVDIAMIKPALDAATSLPLSVPEEPEMALARGAALASAHAPLFASSTQGVAWAQDSGTGEVPRDPIADGYAYVSAMPMEYESTQGEDALAYSAVPGGPDSGYLSIPGHDVAFDDPSLTDSRLLDFSTGAHQQEPKPFLLVGSALATLFVVGVGALVLVLAFTMRPHAAERPNASGHVVVPAQQAPPAKVPAPLPAPKPVPAPVPEAPAPVPQAPAPAPVPRAPAPAQLPAPAPPPALPPPVLPPLFPPLEIPGLPGGPPIGGPRGGGDHDGGDHDGGGWGHGGGHGRGGGGGIPGLPKIPGFHF